ncbi:MAG: hypothetical protein LBI12_04775 [Treponema sp.]|nr:hypothetical protein [Treponema sp.]
MIYEKCRDILLEECEFIQKAAGIQEQIKQAVISKDWTVFEDNLSAMNAVESKMLELESERERLFSFFEVTLHQRSFCENLDEKGRFYKLVSFLPENQRNDLTSIYRSLKIEAIKLRMANDALMAYLSGVQATIKEFFELAFTDRGGKMYTNNGTQFSHDMRSIVLNTQV